MKKLQDILTMPIGKQPPPPPPQMPTPCPVCHQVACYEIRDSRPNQTKAMLGIITLASGLVGLCICAVWAVTAVTLLAWLFSHSTSDHGATKRCRACGHAWKVV